MSPHHTPPAASVILAGLIAICAIVALLIWLGMAASRCTTGAALLLPHCPVNADGAP